LSDNPTLQELLEVQQHFGLPSPALVEKDWYVIKALAAIAAADAGPFHLVFGGGTALSRAHGLTRRMSEDIDLKIVANETGSRPALGRLRDKITDALLGAGFQFDPANKARRVSMHESRYTRYALPYAPIVAGEGALRPEIKIETSLWPLWRPPVERPVISFVAEGFNRPPELSTIACAAIVEIATEKFVALTRRAGAELAGASRKRDPTLVRHTYDLHIIREHYDTADFAILAREIMQSDAKTYGHQFPAYRDDPLAETLRAVEGIAAAADFARGYANFRRDMVYGEAPDFETAIATLKAMAELIQKTSSADGRQPM
jgi:predicted nucleotidyltransferase component of viral defense system